MTIRPKSGNIASDLEWISYTPTGTWTTNVTYSGSYRVVGDTLEQNVRVDISGAVDAALLRIDLANSFTIDSTKFTDVGTVSRAPVGTIMCLDSGSNWLAGIMVADPGFSTTQVTPLMPQISGSLYTLGGTSGITNVQTRTWANADEFIILFKVPIT